MKELNRLENMIGKNLVEVFKETGAMVAGGALTSLFSNQPINDIDVYFKTPEDFEETVAAIYGQSSALEDVLDDYEVKVNHVSSRAVLCKCDYQDIQLIAHRFYDDPEDIFTTFDFTINMAVYDIQTATLYQHPDFMKHLAQRYLHVNPDTSYPLISVLRTNKYKERGYTISKSQMLRLLLAVNKLEITSWDALCDQLGGMYGSQPEDIFDTSKPFDLISAIEQLDSFEIRDTICQNNPDFDDIVYSIPQAFSENTVRNHVLAAQRELSVYTSVEDMLKYKPLEYKFLQKVL